MEKLLNYLYALDGRGIRLGLERAKELATRADNPQDHLKIIHVAGTNGKGSTCAILMALLRAKGFRVGFYSSPHLLTFNERIRVNDEFINDREIIEFIQRMRSDIDELNATFFETTTIMAFDYFYRQKVDYVILEVGLGGRFDATNIITPQICAITPIGKDHEHKLGNTLKKIAFEKAGIIKPNIPCVISHQRPAITGYLKEIITTRKAPFINAAESMKISIKQTSIEGQTVSIHIPGRKKISATFPLWGNHQVMNLQTALTVIEQMSDFNFSNDELVKGIESVKWPGRLQKLQQEPLVLYDVGHNLHGIRQIVSTLKKVLGDEKINILLTLRGTKKINQLGKLLLPLINNIFIAEIPDDPMTATNQEIYKELNKFIPKERIKISETPDEIMTLYKNKKNQPPLLILGSHYIAPVIAKYFALLT